MTYQEAIKKINKLLGLQKFNSYKVAETEQELIAEGELAIGEPLFIITDNGQLPVMDGEYELEDTTKIKIEDGKVLEIKYDMENTNKENFVEAALKDGTIVKSNTVYCIYIYYCIYLQYYGITLIANNNKSIISCNK